METISTKPQDNGAFGSEIEKQVLEKRVQELERLNKEYLDIIRNFSLGKDEVAEYTAAVDELLDSVPVQLPEQLEEVVNG